MKFKFCSDGDCPLWALASLHAISSLPANLFRRLLDCVVDGQNDDTIMDILKDTSLSSRDECARAAAVIRWVLKQAWSSSCPGQQLQRDLLVLGVPRAHASALSDAADDGREEYEKSIAENGFRVTRLTDVSATAGPAGSTPDTVKLSLHTEDIAGERGRSDVLLDRALANSLLQELKTVYRHMEELPVD